MVELILVSALSALGAIGALGVALHHTFQIELLHRDLDRQDSAR